MEFDDNMQKTKIWKSFMNVYMWNVQGMVEFNYRMDEMHMWWYRMLKTDLSRT